MFSSWVGHLRSLHLQHSTESIPLSSRHATTSIGLLCSLGLQHRQAACNTSAASQQHAVLCSGPVSTARLAHLLTKCCPQATARQG